VRSTSHQESSRSGYSILPVGFLSPYQSQAAWFLKVRTLVAKNYIDDTEMEEEAIGDMLMDSNATADNPRSRLLFQDLSSFSSGVNTA
jgi:hypothetical protein